MAPRKLGIRYLHLLSQAYGEHGLYSLRRMDASTLFYPSTSEAKAAAVTAGVRKRQGAPFNFDFDAMGSAQLLKEERELLRGARVRLPREGWRWRPLPPPPFLHQDPHYGVARAATPAYVVVGCAAATRVFVSTAAATYAFDTAAREWSKAGDWALPFAGRAEHVPELGALGRPSSAPVDNPYGIWTVDLTGAVTAAGDGAPPPAQHVGLDLDPSPPEPVPGEGDPEWSLEDQAMVSLGSGRLCVARFFNHYYERYTPALTVFTGVEVVPSGGGGGGFSLIRHKSQCIFTKGATMRVL
ncbi:unnamed protein product [Urochloa decumbens]|uniref:Uncharacterized protein n=1 Tax=Urochloa decumbens TaxID=240449 RepID=A0ABC9BGD8_9POAL